MSNIIGLNKIILEELTTFLKSINSEHYVNLCCEIGSVSIGQHVRHILELYQCLLEGYDKREVNYDKRNRNTKIETDLSFAMATIHELVENLDKKDVDMNLIQEVQNDSVIIKTNYYRELLYNFEHCVHHKALIKVACHHFTDVKLKPNFGIAPSTLKYKENVYS